MNHPLITVHLPRILTPFGYTFDQPMFQYSKYRRLSQRGGLLFLVLLLTVYLSSCRRPPILIAVIPQTTGTALWTPVLAGVQSVARNRHIHIYWNAPTSAGDVKAQIALLEHVIRSKRYAGIVLAPDHSLALASAVQRAEASGIPVVVISSRLNLPPGPKLSYVLNNDTQGGEMAANYLGRILRSHGSIAIMGVNPALDGNMQRLRSFEITLHKLYPQITIQSEHFGAFNLLHEEEVAAHILKMQPHVKAIVALNTAAERGAWLTLLGEHRENAVPVIGFDQNIVVDGAGTIRIRAIVEQNTYKMGRVAIMRLLAKLHHNHVPSLTLISPRLVIRTPPPSQVKHGSAFSGRGRHL